MKKPDLAIIGGTGGLLTAWWDQELPEFGRTAIDQYAEMRDSDAVIGGAFFALEALFRRVAWIEQPAEKPKGKRGAWTEARANAWASFLGECREDMSHTWPGFVAEIMTMLPFGWAYFEVCYKYRRGPEQTDARYRSRYEDNRIGWRKIALRRQNTLSRWALDGDGGVSGMYQTTGTGEVFIPIQKAILFRTTEAGHNPEGRSLLKNARRAYFYRKNIETFEAIGIERNAAGLPDMQVPIEYLDPEAKPEIKATLAVIEQMLAAIRRDERGYILRPAEDYVVEDDESGKPVKLPTGFKLGFVRGGEKTDVSPVIERYSSQIAISLLAGFLMLGQGSKGGAYALSGDLTDLFELAATGILDGVTETINRFLVAPLMQLNGVPPELWPRLTHGGLSKAELKATLGMIAQILQAGGVTADPELERYLRDRLGVPERAEEEPEPEPEPTSKDNPDPDDAPETARLDIRFEEGA